MIVELIKIMSTTDRGLAESLEVISHFNNPRGECNGRS
jgi:hypothetical protein